MVPRGCRRWRGRRPLSGATPLRTTAVHALVEWTRSRPLLGPRCHAAAIGEPSTAAPGGLSPEDTPQFVLLTHDDGVDAESRGAMLKLLKGKKAAQGCPLTATMFTLMDPEGWTCERQGGCLWGLVWLVQCKAAEHDNPV